MSAFHALPGWEFRKQPVYPKAYSEFWSMYMNVAKDADGARLERWKGDAEGILLFTSLFSATIATFVSSSNATLSPDNATDTVLLLRQLVLLANGTMGTVTMADLHSTSSSFSPSASAVWINSLWYLSLFISLSCALLAILVQQWTRRYIHGYHASGSSDKDGPIHAYLSRGVDVFRLDDCIAIVTSLLHLSVLLFYIGLLISLFSANSTVAWVVATGMISGLMLYIPLSVLPLIYLDSPYRTPLTHLLRSTLSVLQPFILACHKVFVLTRLRLTEVTRSRPTQPQVHTHEVCKTGVYFDPRTRFSRAAFLHTRTGSDVQDLTFWIADDRVSYAFNCLMKSKEDAFDFLFLLHTATEAIESTVPDERCPNAPELSIQQFVKGGLVWCLLSSLDCVDLIDEESANGHTLVKLLHTLDNHFSRLRHKHSLCASCDPFNCSRDVYHTGFWSVVYKFLVAKKFNERPGSMLFLCCSETLAYLESFRWGREAKHDDEESCNRLYRLAALASAVLCSSHNEGDPSGRHGLRVYQTLCFATFSRLADEHERKPPIKASWLLYLRSKESDNAIIDLTRPEAEFEERLRGVAIANTTELSGYIRRVRDELLSMQNSASIQL